MEMKEALQNSSFKVLEVSLNKGEAMPLHKASSDAYVINRQGKGKITIAGREVILNQGETFLIPANQEHTLDILEDFRASIVMFPEAKIDFVQ
ncbi:MAG TPA: cupin domain-containing protein [Edaphocola sp.]|nr:cupin domain-containing protein [Edaphocola sp.]